MASIACAGCQMNILKEAKFCSECGTENVGDTGKRSKTTELGSDAAAIVAAINRNTDEKFKELKSDINEIKSEGRVNNLEKNSLDFYASVKSLYLQDRQQKILNSKKIINTQDDSDWEEIQN